MASPRSIRLAPAAVRRRCVAARDALGESLGGLGLEARGVRSRKGTPREPGGVHLGALMDTSHDPHGNVVIYDP